jgi:hypothetical protein
MKGYKMNVNNVRREISRHFRSKKMDYLKSKSNDPDTNRQNKNIRNFYRETDAFMKGY